MTPWKILDQTQTEHLGGYCDLSHSIEIEGGSMRLVQRIEDSAEGYKVGQDRANLIAVAPEMLAELEVSARYFIQRKDLSEMDREVLDRMWAVTQKAKGL